MNRHDRRKQAAAERAASDRDFVNVKRQMDSQGINHRLVGFDEDFSQHGDGDRTMIAIHIGARGRLTVNEAKTCVDAWRKAVANYPKGIFCPGILGFDEYPRELWEFEEVRDYVRRWAKFAGITGPQSIEVETTGPLIGLLAACGCDGFEHIIPTMDDKPLKPTTSN